MASSPAKDRDRNVGDAGALRLGERTDARRCALKQRLLRLGQRAKAGLELRPVEDVRLSGLDIAQLDSNL